ncbi:hypothetical protein AAC387_Pa03g4328 [Persea americana]
MFMFLHQHSSLLTVLFVILFFYPLAALFVQHRKPSKLPPGTLGWLPYLGHTLSFLAPHLSTSRGHFLEHNIKRYGKIFRCHVFGHPTIVSCDADFNSFILQNDDRLLESSYPANIPGVLGDLTLLVATGDLHKRLRGALLNFFTTINTQNSNFLRHIEDNVLRVMAPWANKKTLIFCQETRKFTFAVIAKQVLSLGPEDVEFLEILHNFKTFMKGLVSLPINLPGTAYAKAIHAQYRIKAITKSLLQQRKGRGEAKEDEGKMDFLDVLLAHDHLSEEEILSLVMDLLLGGYETTSIFIAIVVRFLSDHPKALDELRREHERVRRAKGEDGDGRLEWDDYKKMNFTQDVIKEALRCGNVVKFVHRKAIKPIHFKGFEIPVGWKVLPIFSGVHLDPSQYSNPQEFNPWRWKEYEKMGEFGSGCKGFTPFAGGRRLCPGSEVAKLETAVFLHHLVLNFSWAPLIDTDRPMCFPFLDFKHGFPISIQPICPSSL